jgi:signal transduction histidine kinase
MVPFPTVLLISDDPKFSPALIAGWQKIGNVPDFVCMTGEVPVAEATSAYTLAIVGPVNAPRAEAALNRLARAARPVIFVSRDPHMLAVARTSAAAPICIRQGADWIENVIQCAIAAIGGNIPHRIAATEFATPERELLLGRCMMEMRHTLNNALTSIMGNAELMMLDQSTLPETTREQAATIHEMALRINELFRHMASLETELQLGGSPEAVTGYAGEL